MAGHNKWSSIKHKKGAADAKRGKVFSRITKEIVIAAKEGGANLDGNPRLKTALLTAKAANMPKDNIDRAIKRGTGDLEGVEYEQIFYEGYTAGGAAILVEVLTENKNRAASEVRHAFTKYGGNLGEPGSVAWMFKKVGSVVFEDGQINEEEAMNIALEAGAEDINAEGEVVEITSELANLEAIKEAFEAKGYTYNSAGIDYTPSNMLELASDSLKSALKLLEIIDELDDVQKVWSNLDFSDEEAAALED